jgi:hypothetical protein
LTPFLAAAICQIICLSIDFLEKKRMRAAVR